MKKTGIVLIMAGILMAGCSQDGPEINISGIREPTEPIAFMPSKGDMEEFINGTRASQTTTGTLATFGVSAAAYPAAQNYTTNACGNYFHDLTVSTATGYTGYYWPGSANKMSFYAHTPVSGTTVSTGLAGEIGKPTYTISVPTTVSQQQDFMTAEVLDRSGAGSASPVALSFSHRLSDIRITAYNKGVVPLTLKSVSLYGTKYNGTYKGGVWTLTGAANSRNSNAFTISPNSSIAAGASLDVTGTTNHIMVPPQTIASGTEILDVLINIESADRHFYHALPSNMVLTEGLSYSLTLRIGYEGMTVTMTASDWEISPYYQPAASDWDTFENIYGRTVAEDFKSWLSAVSSGKEWGEDGQGTTVDINGWD